MFVAKETLTVFISSKERLQLAWTVFTNFWNVSGLRNETPDFIFEFFPAYRNRLIAFLFYFRLILFSSVYEECLGLFTKARGSVKTRHARYSCFFRAVVAIAF